MPERDGIAVVGMACRMPGAPDLAALWRLLRDGVEAVGEPPSDRVAGCARGGFIAGADMFDADFFGISPKEAAASDPQQRLALELSWECIEDAGIVAERIAHSAVGVFVGVMGGDYAELVAADRRAITHHSLTGVGRAVIANRISYALRLGGPSLTVDTGQSSSLVAVHLACESLLRGESELAVAGGMNLILSSFGNALAAEFGALSPEGRCYAFDARANGHVRGEGGGMVVLKRLTDALADGDRVYGVISGSAMNTGSDERGMTVPSQGAQVAVIEEALTRSGIDSAAVQYVELHGTGTPVGDPIEAAALGAAYGRGRPGDVPLAVGSIKTNIGHLEGAAGIAGLIKAVLCVHRRELVASLNFEEVNPRIPLEQLGLRVVRVPEPWPAGGHRIAAGVSSFGMGGTNAHLIIQEPPPAAEGLTAADAPGPFAVADVAGGLCVWPLLVSGRGTQALRAQAARLHEHLARAETPLADVACSLVSTRAELEDRAVVIGGDREGLLAGLRALSRGEPAAGVVERLGEGASRTISRSGEPVFVFPGQGSQWEGMAVELLDSSDVFADSLRACAQALEELVDWRVEDVLRGAQGAPALERIDVVQPVLFAVIVSLAGLWRACGVQPGAVVGHSQGEIAAAHVAGGLSLGDAARLVVLRSRLLTGLVGRGGIMSVALGERELRERLEPWGDRVVMSAFNGPSSTAVAGDPESLRELLAELEGDGVRARVVPATVATHSRQAEPLREELLAALGELAPRSGEIPFFSTVTGGVLDTAELDAEYWYRNLREPVRLERATRALLADGRRAFVEVSPHPVLTFGVRETLEHVLEDPEEGVVTGSLRRRQGGVAHFLHSLAEAWVHGVQVDWRAIFAGSGARRVDLPTYAFQRERYWLARQATADEAAGRLASPPDPEGVSERTRGEEPQATAGDSVVASARFEQRREGVLARRLADAPTQEWDGLILEMVCSQLAGVLGHDSSADVQPRRAFKELGLDSVGAEELRRRLVGVTGLRLPATLAFDYPSAAAVAGFLRTQVDGTAAGVDTAHRTALSSGAGSDEPIAIVGMSCRYPGPARTPEELWELVAEGRDATSDLPVDRGWDLDGLYDSDPEHPGTSYTRRGGFIEDVGDFDATFFGIGPREALAMDPQQRLLLEAAWEALERAGIDPHSLRGSATGVFAGLSIQDYLTLQGSARETRDGFRLTGSLASVLSGRVAYTFGFEGPAVSVDTACSSSLVALHLACQAVRRGECSLALVGGVTVMASPAMLVEFSRQRGLAADGRCKAFAASADGTGWSEGVGVVVLERLSDAQRLGHRVQAVVRGSAVNQDGKSNGLTAPNGPSQERVIRLALADAGLSPSEVDVVEAHGTGTKLGDPIEAQALLATYGQARETGPLWLGSIKSNIGHPQAAAGMAGVIKMVKAFEHEQLPRTLHVDAPTPHVDWSAGDVQLLTEPLEWRANGRVRRAGVSSFGISGTNAHVILEEPPRAQAWAAPAPSGTRELPRIEVGASAEGGGGWRCGVVPLAVSGRGEGGLRGQAARLGEFLAGSPEVAPLDVALSLIADRAVFEERGVVLGVDGGALVEGLRALAGAGVAETVVRGVAREGRPVFVFPGQGAQWEGMAVELLGSSGVFGEALRACGRALEELVEWRVEDVLRGVEGAPTLERVDVVQPVSFAVMVALAELWRSFGVEPGVVVGHSQGEIAAACVAGGLSLPDAARVVVLRSRLLGELLAGRGGMVSIALDVERVQRRIEEWGGRLSVAAVNGPSAVVVSGENRALDELLEGCGRDDVWARRVAVDYASHSTAVESLGERLVEALRGLEPAACGVRFFSTATGGFLDTAELDGGYWYRSLRERVRFEEATRALAPEANAFIEVSPHPVLGVALRATLEDMDVEGRVAVLDSLRRGEGGFERFLRSLAEAWVAGVPVDWRAFFVGSGARRIELPTYAFQRERYWLSPGVGAGDVRGVGMDVADHPLLGAAVPLAAGEGWLFTGRLGLDTHAWLADHGVLDTVLLPGTGFLELVSAAGRAVGCAAVEELTLQAPLVLDRRGGVQLQVAVGEPDGEGRRRVSVHSRPQTVNGAEHPDAGGWTHHASGTLVETGMAEAGMLGLGPRWPPTGAREVDVEVLYDRLGEAGFDYGPVFQRVQAAWAREGEIYAEVALDADAAAEAARYGIHPALLDAALHVGLLEWGAQWSPDGRALPFAIAGVHLRREGASSLRVCLTRAAGNTIGLTAYDETGELVLSMDSLSFRPLEAGRLAGARPASDRGSLLGVEWVEAPVPEADEAAEAALRGASLGGLEVAGLEGERYGDLAQLARRIAQGAPAPDVVFAAVSAPGADLAEAARAAVGGALELLREWLAEPALEGARLVLLTSGAVAVVEGEIPDPAGASVWGLLRSAQSEHPGRLVIVDADPTGGGGADPLGDGVGWSQLVAAGEQLALRGGRAYVPRLAALEDSGLLLAPAGESRWHLGSRRRETLEDLALIPSARAWTPLGAGEVRVAVRASGLNFRDVSVALGLGREAGQTTIGGEGAGVVLEVGEGVEDLAPGDRVMGLMDDAFGPVAVTDRELVVRMPDDWSFVRAAAVPSVFMTAYHGLLDLAGLEGGESLLINSAADGVGMAALQIARHLGVEVFATASPAQAAVLAELGLDPEHIGSSRDLDFGQRFLRASGGRGVDVVLNSLAREFVDASLGLLPRGGRFIEMGKADVRDAERIAREHAGVRYRAFDLYEAGPQRIQQMLQEILSLFEQGVLTDLPITTWDVRRGGDAFRFMRDARHVGKIVLTVPRPPDTEGTILITGGTGGLGALVARHLATAHGARRLLLASRRGPDAEGASELVAELAELGCEVSVVACDVADRAQASELIASIPGAHPLTSVIHTAGVLDDGLVKSLTVEQLERVMRPKVDAALHLHELTQDLDLAEFILFSSAAGLFGGAGQGNYAAANAFLDALAQDRQARGLVGQSLAWGLWEGESGMTGGLGETGRARMARAGLAALPSREGLALLDRGRAVGAALLVAARLDMGGLRAQARVGVLPALLRGLVRAPSRRARSGGGSLARRLAGAPEAEWDAVVLDVVCGQAAAVLGHDSPAAIDRERPLNDQGLDSLGAVELRNRLVGVTDLQLPSTLVFDRPSCGAIAGFLRSLVDAGHGSAMAARGVVARRAAVDADERVAIVGMSCRYPGSARTPQELWELVAGGRDAISPFPEDRGWDLEGLYDPDPDHPGTSYSREGGFIADAADFDAGFFGISPREALAMDPQQRVLLEVAWEALEDAGIAPASLRGSQTGVFAGTSLQDYVAPRDAGVDAGEGFRLTGYLGSVLSGRVAYTFGFEGPAVSVDTACSSSLVALHLACQAVRNGECALALAGGVTLMASPAMLIDFSRQRGLSVDGRCKPFAACADGIGVADGAGLVVVERLSDARRLGHRVLAVVRGSAVNQDGASNGLTAPNGPSQERVIRRALADAGLAPGEVGVVEAHGTGTALGDPIEAEALLAAYGQERTDGPLWLGSVKSNIGHAQAAAGVAGVIKMVKAFEHGLLPRTLHVDAPTPHVDWSGGAVELLTESRAWRAGERPRRAGVSSFGISGTNAHMILEEPPREQDASGAGGPDERAPRVAIGGGEEPGGARGVWGSRVVPLVVSGRGEAALRGQAQRLRELLLERPESGSGDRDVDLLDVAFSLAGRVTLGDRGVVLGEGRADALQRLSVLAEEGVGDGVVRGVAHEGRPVFVFPGQGAQWEGMALELLDASSVFADSLRACGRALEELVDWRVEDVLRGVEGAPALERVDVVQPVSFAVMVALAELWRSFGVRPGVVVGHSQGEIAAACVAGGLSLQDAARVVVLRSRLLGEVLAGRGGMVSVALGVMATQERIGRWGGRLAVAAVNGPSAVVVSGENDALDEFLAACESDHVWARRVAVDYASHSAAVEELREALLEELGGIEPVSCGVPFFSTATGELVDTAQLDAEYWYRSLRERVRFEEGVRGLAGDASAFIEVSPHPVLAIAVRETLEDLGVEGRVGVVGSLRRSEGGLERFVHSLAEAWACGVPVDWPVLFAGSGARRVELPRYAFQRERYWLSPRAGAGDASGMGLGAADHPFLGAAVPLAGGEGWLFTGRLSLDTHAWLADHAALDTVLLPGTGFLELVLAAGRAVGCEAIEELTLQAPLVLEAGVAVQVQVLLGEPEEDGRRQVTVYSRPQEVHAQTQDVEGERCETRGWTQHASATLLAELEVAAAQDGGAWEGESQWPPAGAEEVDVEFLYDRLAEAGYGYGPAFQGVRAAWRQDEALFVEVALAADVADQAARFAVHPALLDAALHGLCLLGGRDPLGGGVALPFSLAGVTLRRRGASTLRVRLARDASGAVRVATCDDAGASVLSIDSLTLRPLETGQLSRARGAAGGSDSLYHVEWVEIPVPEPGGEAPRCVLLGGLGLAGVEGERYGDVGELVRALEDGAPPPEVVFAPVPRAGGEGDVASAARVGVRRTLALLQQWLAAAALGETRLVWVSAGAVAAEEGEVPELVGAAVWGLLRSALAEHPGRFVIADAGVGGGDEAGEVSAGVGWLSLVGVGEPQLAVRGGRVLVPRLVELESRGLLAAPARESRWHLTCERGGTLEDLALVRSARAWEPLGAGQVRVAVHAAGMNFRDVIVAHGLLPGALMQRGEGAGVVLEVGEGVSDLAVGDRVMGLMDDAFGPVAVTARELVVPVPEGWSFTAAASVPIVFLTAYYGLVDLAGLQRGESVLVHAAAGGVGMAALQIARHLGAEVFATASPAKAGVLAGLGVDEEHIASSRDLEFAERFLRVSRGRGVDVVLNSLAREFVDSSLGLLPGGGRFIEMGKTDIREAELLAREHPSVRYRAFDLHEADSGRIQEMLREVVALFERGVFAHLPVTTWDVRRGIEAFRFMREGRHVGKIVLTVPQPVDPGGTVLITGGTSGLGALTARHLATRHGARHLLLASRSGPRAAEAGELVEELAGLGCTAEAVACDVADREQLRAVLDAIPPERPLTAVIHSAGVLDDGTIESLSAEQVERAMRPKVDAALNLHELAGAELAEFVLFSSATGHFGGAGQGNYTAANAFMDALAQTRRARGLPAQSLAWGMWERESAMTSGLGEAGRARIVRLGIAPLPSEEGLELLDRARTVGETLPVTVRLDRTRLLAQARAGVLPPLLSGLVQVSSRQGRRGAGGSLARRLAGTPESERDAVTLELVRSQVAGTLGHGSGEGIDPERAFKDLGFDSLSAVELRNRLTRATGLRLPATLGFDHPNCRAVAAFLRTLVQGEPASAGSAARGGAVARGEGVEEPIAIVGMSCRYPGGVCTPQELWELVAAGGDAISKFPADRGWDVESLYDPHLVRPGTSYTREGGFLHDAGDFDAGFFGVSPREALGMDPQQRLLLEATWEALEDAGIDPVSLRGSQTGVFAGVIHSGYGAAADARSPGEATDDYLTVGSMASVVSGRVAYTFGFEGPAVSVDTACSSSLVALHLACQAIRQGECELALAGGVAVLCDWRVFVWLSRQRVVSVDGRCRSFAASADGSGFSDGVGLLALERLSDARRLGHRVLGVVRGSAVNQDGASNGLTAPNGPSQERVIRRALADAGLAPGEVDVVEAHGTGTTLGDPIEAQALLATYGQGRTSGPLWLGSIKSNIGHAQAAAGVAGVIKMVKAFEHGLLPGTLHVDQPTPHVDWSAGEVELLTEARAWPVDGRPRRAGVSSFGLSGTNAHVVLEEPPVEGGVAAAAGEPGVVAPDGEPGGVWGCGVVPLVVSGRGVDGLCGQAGRLGRFLGEHPDAGLLDVAFSLVGRSVLGDRGVVLGCDRGGLVGGLEALAGGEVGGGVVRGVACGGRPVFVFPGQGAQWEGMAVELLDSSPVFGDALRACGRVLEGLVDWGVEDVLRGVEGAPSLDRVDVVQPVSFAVMVALAGLWRSFGVEPGVVVGHSQGEIAAACVAGGLSLEDAARVVVLRSRLLGEVLAGRGGMVSVALDVDRVEELLEGWGGRLGVAAVNGPSAVVVSGESGALDELLGVCERDGVWARRVAVDYASHSVAVEELRERLVGALVGIEPVSCGVPFFSTATGGLLDTAELDGEYWYRSLRERVRFCESTRALVPDASVFIEVSPHPVLTMAVQGTLEDVGLEGRVGVVGSLQRGEGGMGRFVRSLAQAWVGGAPVDWGVFFEGSGAQRVDLPRYAFQRERYWLTPRAGAGDVSHAGLGVSDHPLLGAAVQLAGGEGWLFTGRLALDTHPWLADHAVLDTVLLPGTGFLELALAAGREVGCRAVEELTLQAPLVLTPGAAVQLQVAVGEPDGEGRRQVTVYSRPQAHAGDANGLEPSGLEGWTQHATGTLLESAASEQGLESLGGQWPPAGAQELDVEFLYDRLAEAGFGYGPVFQGVQAAWREEDAIFVEVALEDDVATEAGRFAIHPALLDAALHSLFLLQEREGFGFDGVALPFSLGGVSVHRGGVHSLRVRLTRGQDRTVSVVAFDEAGELVLSVGSLALRPLEAGQLRGARDEGGSLLRCAWVELPVPGVVEEWPSVAVLGGFGGPVYVREGGRYADLGELVRAVTDGAPAPGVVVVSVSVDGVVGGVAEAARAGVRWALGLLQAWLAQRVLVESRLVFVTRGAVAVGEGEVPDLVGASVWGLLRSAQSENPGRFLVVDLDPLDSRSGGSVGGVHGEGGEELDWAGLLAAGEPQVAVRGGCVFVPRLEPVVSVPQAAPVFDPEGTVLLTGGTGTLGALVARHLAVHGVRRLLLVSRSGVEAEGAEELLDELGELGCEARIVACDVCERDQVRGLAESVAPEHPLTAVIHTAGAVRDGVIESLTVEQVDEVMRPKVDAALHLHELTEGLGRCEFVLFSSAAGVLGGAGQGNYAAANAFLDALAQARRAWGQAGVSLAWGLWEQASGLTGGLGEAGRARIGRQGIAPLSSEQALGLFDGGRAAGEGLLVAVRWDLAGLRAQARVGVLPSLLDGLVRVPARRERGGGSLARRLAGVPKGEWDAVILEVVRGQAATVLGHDSAVAIDPERAFKELGFDSLGAVELRNRLTQVTGVRLPATLVFDHPSCAAVAGHLRSRVEGQGRGVGVVARRRASVGEPVAIVGMSCRYPGGVATPQDLWGLVAQGRDAISGFPADRGWDLEALYHPDPDHPGTSYTREGGFVHDVGEFDAGFFGISPREAVAMDPQQRLLLEATWEALEDAGIDPASLRGSQTGVFAGVISSDYGLSGGSGSTSEQAEGYLMFGAAGSVVSGRVAYTFGFEGPAVSVDTACSSSLVALHLACQAVRQGECSLALAGGVTVLFTPRVYVGFSRQRGLSTDGRCRSFAAAADGTGFSEGAGLLVLERLSDARRLGHRVLAVVRGSAVNQDGASNGLSAPNGPSQERVIRSALADGGLAAAEIDAVEAHGTGTTLGDPIEAQALIATYGQERTHGPLRLGSIKSNIGHAQAAAGMAGVIKMVKALEHELLPRTLHVDAPSPQVDWSAGEVELLTEPQPWPAGERPRRVGISSFGASGTNAHVVIEEAPAEEGAPESSVLLARCLPRWRVVVWCGAVGGVGSGCGWVVWAGGAAGGVRG